MQPRYCILGIQPLVVQTLLIAKNICEVYLQQNIADFKIVFYDYKVWKLKAIFSFNCFKNSKKIFPLWKTIRIRQTMKHLSFLDVPVVLFSSTVPKEPWSQDHSWGGTLYPTFDSGNSGQIKNCYKNEKKIKFFYKNTWNLLLRLQVQLPPTTDNILKNYSSNTVNQKSYFLNNTFYLAWNIILAFNVFCIFTVIWQGALHVLIAQQGRKQAFFFKLSIYRPKEKGKYATKPGEKDAFS